jgi:site-specific DNA recombinase
MELAAIYERISDDREGRELGVERQGKDCTALVVRDGLKVYGRYRDNDISASTKSRKPRPDYDRLLADAKAGKFQVIYAYTTGRLTRRPRENEDLIDLAVEYGIRYRFIRSPTFDLNTAQGREAARSRAARDAGEAEEISERVAAAALDRAERGEFHGGARPYGVTADGRSLVDSEAAEIRRWCSHVLAGGSLPGICADLERRGVPTATGKPAWRSPVIRKIIMNPRIAGLRIVNSIEYKAPNPPIVPEPTWRAVRTLLEDPGRVTNHTGTARKHVGVGLFWCLRCTQTVNANYDRRGNLLYRCLRCFRSWRAEPINAWIDDLVEARLEAEDARERLLPKPAKGVDVQALRTERDAIGLNLGELAADFALARGATKAALKVGLDSGQARLDEIEAELAAAGRVDAVTALLAADDPVAAYRDIQDLARRQAVLRSILIVRLGAPIRGRAPWDAAKFMGASQWVGGRTLADIWTEAGL